MTTELPNRPRHIYGTCLESPHIWVIAPGGDTARVLAPYLESPPLDSIVQTDIARYTENKIVHVPDEWDVFNFALEVGRIDPLLLVNKKSEVDRRGLHRYGWVEMDYKSHSLVVTRTFNKEGIFEYAFQRKDRIFSLFDEVKAKGPRKPTVPDPGNDFEGSLYETGYWLARGVEMMEELKQPDNRVELIPNLAMFAKINSVDFDTSCRVAENNAPPSWVSSESLATQWNLNRFYPDLVVTPTGIIPIIEGEFIRDTLKTMEDHERDQVFYAWKDRLKKEIFSHNYPEETCVVSMGASYRWSKSREETEKLYGKR